MLLGIDVCYYTAPHFLEVTVLKENLAVPDDARANITELGRRVAEQDLCRTNQASACSDDLRVPRDYGRYTNARLFFRLPGQPDDLVNSTRHEVRQ